MHKNTCKNIVIIILLVFVLLLGYQIMVKKENFTMTEQSNEAVQNIASVYADTSNTATFNNINTTGNLNVTGNFNMLPRGSIIAWYDVSTNNAPDGWHICDGTMGTPDLRGRFILGYITPTYPASGLTQRAVGSGGGEENHTLTVNEIPSHSHTGTYKMCVNCGINGGGSDGWAEPTNNGTTGSTGGNGAHNNMPPFTVLKYIMKM